VHSCAGTRGPLRKDPRRHATPHPTPLPPTTQGQRAARHPPGHPAQVHPQRRRARGLLQGLPLPSRRGLCQAGAAARARVWGCARARVCWKGPLGARAGVLGHGRPARVCTTRKHTRTHAPSPHPLPTLKGQEGPAVRDQPHAQRCQRPAVVVQGQRRHAQDVPGRGAGQVPDHGAGAHVCLLSCFVCV
jgi:hypothetical protein